MFKKEAHEYLTNSGCLSIGQKYTAFEIEKMLNEFAQHQVKNLVISAYKIGLRCSKREV